jgi:hypothetical protein
MHPTGQGFAASNGTDEASSPPSFWPNVCRRSASVCTPSLPRSPQGENGPVAPVGPACPLLRFRASQARPPKERVGICREGEGSASCLRGSLCRHALAALRLLWEARMRVVGGVGQELNQKEKRKSRRHEGRRRGKRTPPTGARALQMGEIFPRAARHCFLGCATAWLRVVLQGKHMLHCIAIQDT